MLKKVSRIPMFIVKQILINFRNGPLQSETIQKDYCFFFTQWNVEALIWTPLIGSQHKKRLVSGCKINWKQGEKPWAFPTILRTQTPKSLVGVMIGVMIGGQIGEGCFMLRVFFLTFSFVVQNSCSRKLPFWTSNINGLDISNKPLKFHLWGKSHLV